MIRLIMLICLLALPVKAQLNNTSPFYVAGILKPAAGGGPTFPANCVAYWKMDEASGTRVDFYTGNDLSDMSSVGATAGIINNASSYASASFDYLEAADSADLSMGANVDFSFSFWFRFSSFADANTIIAKDSATQEYLIWFYQVDSKLYFRWWDSGGMQRELTSTATFNNATTYHVVITYDQSNLRIYINGSLDSTQAMTDDVRDANSVFNTGYSPSLAKFANEWIDEVGIWKRALSLSEAQDLYNSGAGLQP